MQSGKLRSRVTIQAPTVTKDGRGQDLESFSDVVTVWADVRQIVGKELAISMATASEVTWRVVVRFSSALAGLTTKHRIQYGDRTLDIIAWNNVEQRNAMIQIDCKEHQP